MLRKSIFHKYVSAFGGQWGFGISESECEKEDGRVALNE